MAKGQVLLVEDDPSVSHVVAAALSAEGYSVTRCSSVEERDKALDRAYFDLLITDIGLGEQDGILALAHVRHYWPGLPVIIMSAKNTLDTAVRASEAGAYEYFPKPFDLDELIEAARNAMKRSQLASKAEDDDLSAMPLIGRSSAMQSVYRMIARLLTNDLTVLILGESGTGKEVVAEAIHNLGHRKRHPFVAVNMAAIPSELIEAELFGYDKGAFTGAVSEKAGKFEQADQGTLFLDEIGDMPMEAQTRLLRALQSGEITRVGGRHTIRPNVRIIAATNQNLVALIEQGRFREDLFYRLNVVPIELPPLRARAEDIADLSRHFLAQAASEGLPRRQLDDGAMSLMKDFYWRGNVRQLKNFVFRLAVTSRDPLIDADFVQSHLLGEGQEVVESVDAHLDTALSRMARNLLRDPDSAGSVYARALAEFEVPLLREAMRIADGNQLRAAALLGINRNTLRKKLQTLDLSAMS